MEADGTDRVEALSAEVEAFLEALERAQYRALAGLIDDPGLTEIYEAHAGLFDPEAFHAVQSHGDGEAARRRAYLREFLAMGIEGHRTRDLQDEALAVEATAVVEIDGQRIPYRRLPVRIRQTADRDVRAAFEAARLRVVAERLNPLHERGLARAHAVAGELLDDDYDGYCERLSGVDFDGLEAQVEGLLAETADAHAELLRHHARRGLPGVPLEALETHDLGRLLHGAEFVDRFRGERMLESVAATVAAMGLEITAGGRIELDLEERETKTPRAFCAPIRVPDEVKLVLAPYGGYDDWATLLHELGHALHYAHVDPGQPMEYRRLGDNGVTEGYAMTFDHLVQLPGFLRDVVGYGDAGDFLAFAAFRELAYLRRYAAKFLYERSLHRAGPGPARAAEYAERLSEATGVRASEELWLEDVDPHFYCVRYLRAWMLAGALHRELRERYDEDWYRNPRTGPFLDELWRLGQRLPAEELAREVLGVERLGFKPLLDMVHARI